MSRTPLQTSSRLTRRAALGGISAGAAAVGLGTTSRVAAQDAQSEMAGHPFVGTWVVYDPADPAGMPTTNIITADGGLIDPTIGAAGVWTATGERTADFTLIALFAEGGGSYYLVRSSITVDAGGDTATNTFSETHVAPDGTILDQRAQATSAYVRLKVEPQDAVGQPMAGFPAWTPSPVATPTS
jgi:hypothetical protein